MQNAYILHYRQIINVTFDETKTLHGLSVVIIEI